MDNIFYEFIKIDNLDKRRKYYYNNIKTIKEICKVIKEKDIKLNTTELKNAGGYLMHRIIKDKEEIKRGKNKAELINCLYKAGADLNYKYHVKTKQNIKITDSDGIIKIEEKRDEHSMTIPEMIKFYNSHNLIDNLDDQIKKLVKEAHDFSEEL